MLCVWRLEDVVLVDVLGDHALLVMGLPVVEDAEGRSVRLSVF